MKKKKVSEKLKSLFIDIYEEKSKRMHLNVCGLNALNNSWL